MNVKQIIENIKTCIRIFGYTVKYDWKRDDFKKHRLAGFLISLSVGIISVQLGIIAACFAAILKEYYDMCGFGTPEVEDCIMTVIGAVFSLILTVPIHWIIWGSVL